MANQLAYNREELKAFYDEIEIKSRPDLSGSELRILPVPQELIELKPKIKESWLDHLKTLGIDPNDARNDRQYACIDCPESFSFTEDGKLIVNAIPIDYRTFIYLDSIKRGEVKGIKETDNDYLSFFHWAVRQLHILMILQEIKHYIFLVEKFLERKSVLTYGS